MTRLGLFQPHPNTSAGVETWKQTYLYDRFGNRAVDPIGSLIPNPTLTLQSLSDFGPTTNRIVKTGFTYDGAGNLTSDPDTGANGMQYDAENRLKSYTKAGSTTTYHYDGDGHRVKKVSGGVTTVFVYNSAGQLVAEYTDSSRPPEGEGGTSYLTTDHLGSTRIVTKQDQTVKVRYDYLPFGEELPDGTGGRTLAMGYGGADATKQKFTQKERDSESQLDYFLARYYSPAAGRFTSPDEFTGGPYELYDFATTASSNPTFYADITEPQTLNKFEYALNNPLKYIDLDGHQQKKSLTEQAKEALDALWEATGGRAIRMWRGEEENPRPNPTQQNYGPGGPLPATGELVQRANRTAGEGLDHAAELLNFGFDQTGLVSLGHTILKYQHGQADKNDVTFAIAGTIFNFASASKALSHYTKHSLEWGFGTFRNALDYVRAARSLVTSTDSSVTRYINTSGKILVYNSATNEFATHTGNTSIPSSSPRRDRHTSTMSLRKKDISHFRRFI